MKSETLKQLEDSCKSIAEELTNPKQWKKDWFSDHKDEYDSADEVQASDWMADVLDITYRVGQDRQYQSAEVCVGLGGPNIYVDTESRTVKGYWGGDRVEIPYTDNLGIDNELQELWEMGA